MKFWTKKRAAALGLAALLTLSLAACGEKAPSLEEVEQAASLVQEAVHPDALTIFGATFDETLDDEIRVTVIATGFDKAPAELPKVSGSQTGAAPAQTAAAGAAAAEPQEHSAVKAPEPVGPEPEPEDDPFEDIFKIFNKRD